MRVGDGGLSLALLRVHRGLLRFPAERSRKTCDSVSLEMLSLPPAPPSLAVLTLPTAMILLSPVPGSHLDLDCLQPYSGRVPRSALLLRRLYRLRSSGMAA